jgi:crotonobetainyl-CoA:carnitine CoA-transferase CaiB-like acyl-CoA transferase
MSVTGSTESGPVKVGAPVLDIGSAISCALGVVSALYARRRTGTGAHVTSSLIEFALACFTTAAPALFVDDELPTPMGSHSPTFAPYGAFEARDGSLVVAGAGSEQLWLRFCEVLTAPELPADPRFATNADRVRHLAELVVEVESRLASHDVDHWLARFADAGVPAARVRDLRQALASPQVAHLGLVRTEGVGDRAYRQIGPPVQVDGALAYGAPAPTLGEHDAEIRAGLAARLHASVASDGTSS